MVILPQNPQLVWEGATWHAELLYTREYSCHTYHKTCKHDGEKNVFKGQTKPTTIIIHKGGGTGQHVTAIVL